MIWIGYRLASASVLRDLSRIVAPLQRVDQLLLACTHYPALAPLFRQRLPEVRLLDPADALARWVAARWAKHAHPRADRFFTTGDRRSMQRAAAAAWGLELARIEELPLR